MCQLPLTSFSGRVCRNDAALGFDSLCNPPTGLKHTTLFVIKPCIDVGVCVCTCISVIFCSRDPVLINEMHFTSESSRTKKHLGINISLATS